MNQLKARIQAVVAAQIVLAMQEEGEEAVAFAIREGTTFEEAIAEIASYQAESSAMAEAIAGRIRDMVERKGRFIRREETARRVIGDLLRQANVRKVELPECTLSLGHTPPSVRIVDETKLPDAFVRIKREPDKAAIKEALKKGEAVEGAELSNGGESLTIRRK